MWVTQILHPGFIMTFQAFAKIVASIIHNLEKNKQPLSAMLQSTSVKYNLHSKHISSYYRFTTCFSMAYHFQADT
jgi:hypothetical protein